MKLGFARFVFSLWTSSFSANLSSSFPSWSERAREAQNFGRVVMGIWGIIGLEYEPVDWVWIHLVLFFVLERKKRFSIWFGEMGCFSCFDSKEDEKLNPAKESNDRKQGQPTISSNISGLTSG